MILSSVISVPCYLLFGSHLSLSLTLFLSLTMVMVDFALVISLHGFPQSLVKVGADMVGHNGADDEPRTDQDSAYSSKEETMGWRMQVACDDELWVRLVRGCWWYEAYTEEAWGWQTHREGPQSKAKILGVGAGQLVRSVVVGQIRVPKGMEAAILSSSLFRIDHVC
jgi:hypothetical protein